MYKRFGNPYKIAFLSFREQEKRDILEAAAKRFDEDTAEYEDGLECKQNLIQEIYLNFIGKQRNRLKMQSSLTKGKKLQCIQLTYFTGD